MRFVVEVEYTDRTRLPSGRFRTFTTQVDVVADSEVEAQEVAAQMVDAIRRTSIDGMVTSTRVLP